MSREERTLVAPTAEAIRLAWQAQLDAAWDGICADLRLSSDGIRFTKQMASHALPGAPFSVDAPGSGEMQLFCVMEGRKLGRAEFIRTFGQIRKLPPGWRKVRSKLLVDGTVLTLARRGSGEGMQ